MDEQAIVAKINEASDIWDLATLETLCFEYEETESQLIREALIDTIGFHYGQMYMDYYARKIKAEPISIVNDLIGLVLQLKRLDPRPEEEVEHSAWLREMAVLHQTVEDKARFLNDALLILANALKLYENNLSLLLEKHSVLLAKMDLPSSDNAAPGKQYAKTGKCILSLLTPENLTDIASAIYQTQLLGKHNQKFVLNEYLANYKISLNRLADEHPQALLLDSVNYARQLEFSDFSDNSLLLELYRRIDTALSLPEFDLKEMDDFCSKTMSVARRIDLSKDADSRALCLAKNLAIADRLISAYPNQAHGYKKKVQYFKQAAQDALALDQQEKAAKLLQEGLAFARLVDPDTAKPYDVRYELHDIYNEKILAFKDKDFNLEQVQLMQENLAENIAHFKGKYIEEEKGLHAAHTNHNYKKMAWLQLNGDDIEGAWQSLVDWHHYLVDEWRFYNYMSFQFEALIEEGNYAIFHDRLAPLIAEQQSLQQNLKTKNCNEL
jgi:hypothetical protein